MKLLTIEDTPYLQQLVSIRYYEGGKVLMEIIARNYKKVDRQLRDHPQTNDEDWRRDAKYKLGYSEALNDILNLPDEAANSKF